MLSKFTIDRPSDPDNHIVKLKKEPILQELKIKRPGARRQFMIMLFFLVILALILALSYFIFFPKMDSFTLHSYSYTPVNKKDITHFLQINGTLTVSSIEIMAAPQSGIIASLDVSKGDYVTKGQILGRIRAKELEQQFEEKKIEIIRRRREKQKLLFQHNAFLEKNDHTLKIIQEKMARLREENEKYEKLYRSGYLTPEELRANRDKMKEVNEAIYDLDISQKNELVQYEYDLLNIENDIENLKRKIDFIQSQLVECVMRSTLNGQVLDRHEEPGKYAAQNTKLLTIANLSEPVLKIQVPEKDITRIKLHDPVLVDLNGTVYNGYIFRIDPKAKKDENAFIPSIEVEIRFKDIPQKILFGASATAKITVDIRKDALYLPRGAYLITGEEKYVYKIEGNKARKLKVIFGLMTGKEVEIVDGLKEGDTVIISGYQDFTQFDMINLDSDRGNKVD